MHITRTKPCPALYHFTIFQNTCFYLFKIRLITLLNVVVTSLMWGTSAVIIDLVGWVLIKHPLSLTFRRFYIEYQPWITLVYLVMYASPFIAYYLIQVL